MKKSSHRDITKITFDLLKDIDNFALHKMKVLVAVESAKTDNYRDLELVDVTGGVGSCGQDNPHKDEASAIDDKAHYQLNRAHYKSKGHCFTAFNHFIDIKKGPGRFDDYDGYSYKKGSASHGEYQNSEEVMSNVCERILAQITGKKVDEGLNWWLIDKFVHAPGRKWYKGCSPSIENYSYYRDKGKYNSIQAEAKARFPLADSGGRKNKGIPYSVFMPVDNLARYWYDYYTKSTDYRALGPIMHAIQDASIPHHAAGYIGNWHGEYEDSVDKRYGSWFRHQAFKDDIIELFKFWNRTDPSPPQSLKKMDWQKEPAKNWRIDFLVTWVALNAYRSYEKTYNHFKDGWKFDEDDAKELTKKTTAACMVVLKKLSETQTSVLSGDIGDEVLLCWFSGKYNFGMMK